MGTDQDGGDTAPVTIEQSVNGIFKAITENTETGKILEHRNRRAGGILIATKQSRKLGGINARLTFCEFYRQICQDHSARSKGHRGKAILAMAPQDFEFKLISSADIPIYNQDFDDHHHVPEAITVFRKEMEQVDGVIFVTPECNRSVPALKMHWMLAQGPYDNSVWNAKPATAFGNSPGNLSAFGANHYLRQSLLFLNVLTMQQPEVYLPKVNELFDENGILKDFLQKLDSLPTCLPKLYTGNKMNIYPLLC